MDPTVGRRTEDSPAKPSRHSAPLLFFSPSLTPTSSVSCGRHVPTSGAHVHMHMQPCWGFSIYGCVQSVSAGRAGGKLAASWPAIWRNQTAFTVLNFMISFHFFLITFAPHKCCVTFSLIVIQWETFMDTFPHNGSSSPLVSLQESTYFYTILHQFIAAASAASAARCHADFSPAHTFLSSIPPHKMATRSRS